MLQVISHSKPCITARDRKAVQKVLKSNYIARGMLAKKFEQLLSVYLERKYVISTSSGTEALAVCLKALGVNAGDEVILPTYVCDSVLKAVVGTGATPVLCDIAEDWTMSGDKVRRHVTSKTKAIIVVYVFGIAFSIKEILQLNIPVIEDCCQAFGARWNGSMVGTSGLMAMHSFHAIKCLTTGEGGALAFNDESLKQIVSTMIDERKISSGMTDLQAALGIEQLRQYRSFLKLRKRLAERYFRKLRNPFFQLQPQLRNTSMFYRFPVKTRTDIDGLIRYFEKYGISVRRGVDELLHRVLGLPDSDFPTAVETFNTTLSLPLYPSLTPAEQTRIARRANAFHG